MNSQTVKFVPMMKAGGLRNGAERGNGSVYHAVPEQGHDTRKALCGTAPSIMWSSYHADVVTCRRCLKKLDAWTAFPTHP